MSLEAVSNGKLAEIMEALFDEGAGLQSGGGAGTGSGSSASAAISTQEAYGTCTRTMSSIRNGSRHLLLLVPPGSLKASATKACVVQARDMEPHFAKLEDLVRRHEDGRGLHQEGAPLAIHVEEIF